MTKPMHRNSSKKLEKVRTPSGETISRYKKKKTGFVECALCSNRVEGVRRGRIVELSRASKSEKSVSAPFGGHLCGPCRRGVMEKASLVAAGAIKAEDVDFREKPFITTALKPR